MFDRVKKLEKRLDELEKEVAGMIDRNKQIVEILGNMAVEKAQKDLDSKPRLISGLDQGGATWFPVKAGR